MRYRFLVLAFAALLSLAPDSAAQSAANPVMTHYRAYRTALEAGDLATADAEAQAALTASIARDGDGGSTAVLAMNLAQVRLMRGRRAEAYEPALRAFNLASAGAANVDPLMARLVLGRAQLTEDRGRQGRDMLEAAIAQGRSNPALHADTYAAAADLGRWLFSRELYVGALDAWTVAGELAAASGGDHAYARAEAHVGAAASRIVRTMTESVREQARPTDTRFLADPREAFAAADEELAAAQRLMAPYAHVNGADGGVTLGQRMYAGAVAWRLLIRAFLRSHGYRPLLDFDMNAYTRAEDGRPFCHMAIVSQPEPSFPPGASSTFTVGAAVVRFRVDEHGRTLDARVAASIPERWFRDALEQVAPQWSLARLPSSPGNCRYQPVVYQTWMFYFR